jgi:hypothetical protein
MRTKVLLCAAALAASLASSMAQNVYSVNVVGYYNVTIPGNGNFLIANQLNTTNNTLQGLIPIANAGDLFFKYAGGYSGSTYDGFGGAWGSNPTIPVGQGGMFKNNSSTAEVLTFVGEVLQNTSPGLQNDIPVGNSIRASMVPQQGKLTADLGAPAEDGDAVYVYNGSYSATFYDGLSGDWGVPGGPTILVGQGFFFKKATSSTASTSWLRSFTVQ